jgi:hypothetical protein
MDYNHENAAHEISDLDHMLTCLACNGWGGTCSTKDTRGTCLFCEEPCHPTRTSHRACAYADWRAWR